MTQIVFSLTRERFWFKRCCKLVLVYYNERVYSTTGYTPREITKRAKDSEFIQKVRENATKSRRIKKDKDEKYKIGLKVRISNYRT